MKRLLKQPGFFALFLALFSQCSISRIPAQTSSGQTDAEHSVKVYNVSTDVSAPDLLPRDFSNLAPVDCQGTYPGDVQLSLVVDDTGRPRNIVFVHPLGNDLDRLALGVVGADRFNPGRHSGVSVPVAILVNLKLEVCLTQQIDEAGNKSSILHLRSTPTQQLSPDKETRSNLPLEEDVPLPSNKNLFRIGRGVSAPIPVLTPKNLLK